MILFFVFFLYFKFSLNEKKIHQSGTKGVPWPLGGFPGWTGVSPGPHSTAINQVPERRTLSPLSPSVHWVLFDDFFRAEDVLKSGSCTTHVLIKSKIPNRFPCGQRTSRRERKIWDRKIWKQNGSTKDERTFWCKSFSPLRCLGYWVTREAI